MEILQSGPPAWTKVPSFPEGLATFVAFLEEQGASTSLVWVEREDLTTLGRRFWARLGEHSAAARRAEARYELGRQKGLGVTLHAVCRVGSSTACHVWIPRDNTDAEDHMLPPTLKCLVNSPLHTAAVVRSVVRWHWLCLINGRRHAGNLFLRELPSRKARGV
jgi:hypothetical protein